MCGSDNAQTKHNCEHQLSRYRGRISCVHDAWVKRRLFTRKRWVESIEGKYNPLECDGPASLCYNETRVAERVVAITRRRRAIALQGVEIITRWFLQKLLELA